MRESRSFAISRSPSRVVVKRGFDANAAPISGQATLGHWKVVGSTNVTVEVPGTGGPAAYAFCFGDGSGTACPCANASAPGAQEGCLNSFAQGGKLVAAGSSSIAIDTLALQGSLMPNSSALYFQGTTSTSGGAGVTFGDGLRCAGGSVIRLGTSPTRAARPSTPSARTRPCPCAGCAPRATAASTRSGTATSLTHDIAVSPEVIFAQLSGSVIGSESIYRDAWRMVDERIAKAHARAVAEAPFCDLTVFEQLLQRIPANSDVHLANSTPARYAQLFDRARGQRWFSNRGTSGIDGCTSTAVGAAFATQKTTALITGETAFLYDSKAFWNAHLSPHLRIIVIDNGGGNIFRYIDGPDKDPTLLKWFEAPHGRDPMKLAASFDLPCYEAKDMASLKIGLEQLYQPNDKPAMLVVSTDAEENPKVLRDYFKKSITSNTTGLGGGIWSEYMIDDVSVIDFNLAANAGPDKNITLGDSAFIGIPPVVGLECVWESGTTMIGTGRRFMG